MSEKLLPCPFCGSEKVGLGSCANGHRFVNCCECLSSTNHLTDGDMLTEQEAAAAWNRRPSPPEPAAQAVTEEQIAQTVFSEFFDLEDWDRPHWQQAKQQAYRTARNILALLPQAGKSEAGWLPIESAPRPKYGQPQIEVMIAGGTYYDSIETYPTPSPYTGWTLACWDDSHGEWRGENSGGHDEYYWYNPTHWMPKITPPITSGGGDAGRAALGDQPND